MLGVDYGQTEESNNTRSTVQTKMWSTVEPQDEARSSTKGVRIGSQGKAITADIRPASNINEHIRNSAGFLSFFLILKSESHHTVTSPFGCMIL